MSRNRKRNSIQTASSWEYLFIGGNPVFEKDNYLNLDAVITFFHSAYSTSDGMVIKMVGKGAQYQIGYRDSDGKFLMGENNYSLHFPPNMPAANYWSVVLYDADTRGLADNGTPFPTVSSNQKVTYNKDGSADIFFAPNPLRDKNANWIKTIPGRGWFAGVRFYSPTQAYFDQTWKPGDIEKLKGDIQ